MTESEVRNMAHYGVYENTQLNGTIEETHISWVILTRKYAFKIKKPIKLHFLDFSTLKLRKQLCERELELNSRFSDIYLAVLPIRLINKRWIIGGDPDSDVIDYCVLMKRLATSKRLDNVLREKSASEKSIRALAVEISSFHNRSKKSFSPFEIDHARNTFNDIRSVIEIASNNIENQFGEIIERSIGWSDDFLHQHRVRFQQRIDHGLKRDVHGDLHSGNIFLYRIPVLFDCIEFNDQFREIDVLYEIAFLCMDLERFQQKHLSEVFLAEYQRHFPAIQQKEDYMLFTYFKCLRANVRTKVHATSASQAENEMEFSKAILEMKKYLVLMNEYIANIQVGA